MNPDTWDPMDALDELELAEHFKKEKAQERMPEGTPFELDALKNVCGKDKGKIFLGTEMFLSASAPWKKVPEIIAQLDWYEPTCTAKDWKHKDVLLELGQGIAYITLNRPAENNTLNDTVIHGLMDAVFAMHILGPMEIRIVVFKANGKMFSAGMDPHVLKHLREGTTPPSAAGDGSAGRNPIPRKEQSQATKDVVEKIAAEALRQGAFPDGKINYDQVLESMLWQTLSRLPQVSICLCQGSVMSTGLNLIACVDMTFAVESAYFCMEDLQLGLLPAVMMPHLCQKLGPSYARFLTLTAANVTAEEAKQLRLIQEVVPNMGIAHDLIAIECGRSTACGPRSVAYCKELVNGVAGNPITELIGFFTAYKLGQVTVSEEARVGMIALQARSLKPWEEKPITPLYDDKGNFVAGGWKRPAD